MTGHGPPGWEPHAITTRVDGWIAVDPENPGHVPSRVAALIRAARTGDSISDVRARMVARQNAHERTRKRQRAIIERMAKSHCE
jgi:hypothetical protein